ARQPARAAGRAGARSGRRCRRAPARGRAGSAPDARGAPAGSGTDGGSEASRARDARGVRGACSPPFGIACEKAVGPLARVTQGIGPLVEEQSALRGERVGALAVGPLGCDEALLLEPAEQAIEVPHLDPLLAGELRQPLEQVV